MKSSLKCLKRFVHVWTSKIVNSLLNFANLPHITVKDIFFCFSATLQIFLAIYFFKPDQCQNCLISQFEETSETCLTNEII